MSDAGSRWCAGCSASSDFKPLKQCSRCKSTPYCSSECQLAHWPVHKPMCRPYNPHEVWGIEVLSVGDAKKAGVPEDPPDGRFRHILLKQGHHAFSKAELCPATAACGLPVRIFSPVIHMGRLSANHSDDGNQPAVYLRIEVDDGFAPFHWQLNNPGTCIVYREDRKPLTKQMVETIWKWHSIILNAFGYPESDGWAPAKELLMRAPWELFSRQYYKEQEEKGRLGFNEFWSPL